MMDWLEDRDDLTWQRKRLCDLIESTPWLTWLLLTKRIENACHLVPTTWFSEGSPKNVWYGVTAEDQKTYNERVPILLSLRRHLDARRLFVSIEPQLEPVHLLETKPFPDWVIVGGESGAGCRPFNPDWARSLRDQCRQHGISFFMKQLGGFPDKQDDIRNFPKDLQIQEFPTK